MRRPGHGFLRVAARSGLLLALAAGCLITAADDAAASRWRPRPAPTPAPTPTPQPIPFPIPTEPSCRTALCPQGTMCVDSPEGPQCTEDAAPILFP